MYYSTYFHFWQQEKQSQETKGYGLQGYRLAAYFPWNL